MESNQDYRSLDFSRRRGIDRVLNDTPLDRAAWERELAYIDSLILKGPLNGGGPGSARTSMNADRFVAKFLSPFLSALPGEEPSPC